MADGESDYKVGPGRPPLHTRFKKGQSGNLGGRSTKSLPALLTDTLNQTVVVTIDGRRHTITKREAIVTQMVDKSTSTDLRATKMLIDMMKDAEHNVGDAVPPPEPRRLAEADKEVVQQFVARLRRQILHEIEEAKAAEPRGYPSRPRGGPAGVHSAKARCQARTSPTTTDCPYAETGKVVAGPR